MGLGLGLGLRLGLGSGSESGLGSGVTFLVSAGASCGLRGSSRPSAEKEKVGSSVLKLRSKDLLGVGVGVRVTGRG